MPKCPKCEDENPQLGARCPRDGFYYVHDDAYDQAQSDPKIGTMVVDKYVIIGRISKGGMGAVYRAMQLPVEREVAFKVLRTEMEGSDKSRDRFIREARAVSRLTHQNIITLYDFGFDDEQHPYMVMEYAPGEDMGQWLKRDDLTTERILHVTRQLLGALDAAHAEGIVHRDLKPENMIITQTSRDPDFVKLLDFGIARLINETNTRGLTREGEVFGTPHYMAPEQAQGAKEVGPQADVYAVGIMLYELLTGEPPYDAPTPLAVLLMHINEPLPEVRPRPGVQLSAGILALLERATHKDPAQRFADAGVMLGALDQLLVQEGFVASTGAFPGLISADLTGDFSRPPQSSSPPPDEVMHPTVDSIPPVDQDTHSKIAIHDPDSSELIDQAALAQAASLQESRTVQTGAIDDSAEWIARPPSPNRRVIAALGVLVILLLLAGGTVVALSLDEDAPEPPSTTPDVPVVSSVNTPPPQDELTKKELEVLPDSQGSEDTGEPPLAVNAEEPTPGTDAEVDIEGDKGDEPPEPQAAREDTPDTSSPTDDRAPKKRAPKKKPRAQTKTSPAMPTKVEPPKPAATKTEEDPSPSGKKDQEWEKKTKIIKKKFGEPKKDKDDPIKKKRWGS